MVTEESGKKYQVGGILALEKKEKQRNVSFIQEYVTEERLEVPVEFDEGINNLLKKIEVIIMIMVIMGLLSIC